MHTTRIFSLLFSLLALPVIGQSGIAVRSWLDSRTFDDKQVVRGWCQNDGSSPIQLDYQATFVFQEEREVRKGTLLAIPLQPTLLKKAVFIFSSTEFDTVELKLFHRKKLVHSDVYLRQKPAPKPSPGAPSADLSSEEEPITPTPLEPRPVPPAAGDIEIDGLVLDETRSKLAHDFYELFHQAWIAEGVPTKGHILHIKELPGRAGIGSRVTVEIGDKPVTTINLRPGAGVVEDLAQKLVGALIGYFNDPNNFLELDTGDLNGSGLY